MWPTWRPVLAWLFSPQFLSSWSLAGSQISSSLSKPNYTFHGPLNTPSSFQTLLFLGLASTPPASWALPPSSLSSPFNISFAKLLKTWAHTMSPGIQAILRVSVIHDSTAHLRTQIDKERPKLVSKDRLLFFYGYLLSHFSLSQALSQSITWLYLNYMIFCNLCI